MNSSTTTESMFQLMPPLGADEYAALKADIKERGVLVPIERDERGNTLDGHHRLQICAELGIKEYPTAIRVGLSDTEKRAHVRSLNLNRRHLSQSQRRALIAEQLKDTPEKSNRQIAEMLKVSHHTVNGVREKLEGRGQIAHVEVREDTKGRKQPAKRSSVFATDKAQAQRAFDALAKTPDIDLPAKSIPVKRLERIAREQQKKAAITENGEETIFVKGDAEIRLGDFREVLADITPASVDLILTDPPYPREFLPLWADLAEFAARVLKPGGLLVTYTGQTHLPHVVSSLSEHLTYIWTICQLGRGAKTVIHSVRFYSKWKPILVYAKPPYERTEWTDDICGGEGAEKSHHEWQQSEVEARHLVKTFSGAGQLIVDPFIGGGTNVTAAVGEGRRFIGCDVSPGAVAQTRGRTSCATRG